MQRAMGCSQAWDAFFGRWNKVSTPFTEQPTEICAVDFGTAIKPYKLLFKYSNFKNLCNGSDPGLESFTEGSGVLELMFIRMKGREGVVTFWVHTVSS